ncbi:1,4-alpha-glucan branching enzyme GlgB [Dyadobacter beijingensis]|uniref:1,4-alpha-glucan branching enzyme GlgB n=1 Tax=Dyadobacter beijingensis TaxID=365489 RepID=A0ABQ2HPE9_9BACT|nr:1,4-alpha-glucan branching protein GlgB [Dyadobacter beijingensis]GGM86974.1 1,4-alpha-glucan branching enzyme GlgB [Dyadobacter beijingensis]
MTQQQETHAWLTGYDADLFRSGKHYHIYNKLGAHIRTAGDAAETHFAVWAPNASQVSVIGSFNGWEQNANPLTVREDGSGIWEGRITGVEKGALYKYFIRSANGYEVEKGDPYAIYWETPPRTASVVWDLDYEWTDQTWMEKRAEPALQKPLSIYEIHLGSWRRVHEEEGRFLTYRELAAQLPEYCRYMGFTHVEFLPVTEHPFYGSWGYQVTGYFAPSSRYGTPQDFMFLVDALHNVGIGVILDWVPSHFPTDQHGLGYFDGSHLYEHADPRQGFHPDWQSAIFNYGRHEVKSFLISSAIYWLDKFHIDGLRVDAVASMLYLDYSRKEGEWIPNRYGGRENLEAIELLRELNVAVHQSFPGVITIAEESTAWPGVTHSVSNGGLGFDFKWMMGWMHDTLSYFQKDTVYRSYHQGELTFSLHYAFSERFVLPLSHDEVVYGKHALVQKMPGDEWQRLANLRLLYTYMYGHPGGKLLFMGSEFGQTNEWRHDFSLDWNENLNPAHEGVQKLVKDLNALYQTEPALYERNFSPESFEWIDQQDTTNSVLAWARKGNHGSDQLLFIANFTPIVRENYRIGVSKPGYYREIFNSDNLRYGGSDLISADDIESYPIPKHGLVHSLPLTLPPLGVIVLKYDREFEWL